MGAVTVAMSRRSCLSMERGSCIDTGAVLMWAARALRAGGAGAGDAVAGASRYRFRPNP